MEQVRPRPCHGTGTAFKMQISALLRLLVMTTLVFTVLRVHADDMPAPHTRTASIPAPAPTQTLALVALTDLALQRNPKTRQAWAALRFSEAGIELARAGYWPQIDATLSAQRNRALNFSGLPSSSQTRFGASVSLSYLLWDLGARRGQVDRANFEQAAAQLSQNQILQDLILQVEQAYYGVLGLQAVVEANRQSLRDADTHLAAAQGRKASGLATLGDIYNVEAARAGVQLALQQSEGQLAVAVGEAPDTLLPLTAWEEDIASLMPSHSVAALLAAARDARPELLAAKARTWAAAANITVVRGRGLPSLNVAASTGLTEVVDVGNSSQYNAQLSLNIPLFAGFGERAALRQAQAQLDTAHASLDELRAQVELQVWQAYQNLQTARVTLITSAAQLKSAQQAMEVSTARYKSGLNTLLDLLNAQATLATARVQQVQARLDWVAGRAALGHAVGGLPQDAVSTAAPAIIPVAHPAINRESP